MKDKLEQIYLLVSDLQRDEQLRLASAILNNLVNNIVESLEEPEPKKNIGWHAALVDTFGKESLQEIDKIPVNRLFSIINNEDSLVNLSNDNKIDIKRVILNTRSEFVTSEVNSDYEISIDVQNKTNNIVKVYIPKGQVFENKNLNSRFQNIVNADNTIITLEPEQLTKIYLPGHCLNEDLKRPNGQESNVTPLKVNFKFGDQNSVWKHVNKILSLIEEEAKSNLKNPLRKWITLSILKIMRSHPINFIIILPIIIIGGAYLTFPLIKDIQTEFNKMDEVNIENSNPNEENKNEK